MHALQAIEYPQVTEALSAYCDTEPGRKVARALVPSFDEDEVWGEIEKTAEAVALLDHTSVSLVGLADIAGPVRLTLKAGSADGASLWLVGTALRIVRSARAVVQGRRESSPRLWVLAARFLEASQVEHALLSSLDADGTVKDGASANLRAARQKVTSLTKRITDKIQSYLTGRHREYLSDAVVTQRGGRYVVPLRADHKGKIKGIVHDTSASGQTVFIEPEDVVQLGNELRIAEAKEREEVQRVLDSLSSQVGEIAEELLDSLEAAIEFDVLLAKARFASANKGCVPIRRPKGFFRARTLRHPLIPRDRVVPMDFSIGDENKCVLITGPNTGGKTVAIKSVGLAIAMAQSGMLPFAEKAELGVFSQVWADIGDEQSLQQSLSTFSGHVKNIAQALKSLAPNALVLLDEVGAGTDPAEGANLARAVLLEMLSKGGLIVASTHYGELKVFASNAPGLTNASMEFDVKTLRPTYRFQFGVPGSSHAYKIASNHGIPPRVIEEAQRGATQQDLDVANMISKLETAQKQAQRAQSEADRLASRIKELEQTAQERIERADEARARAREEAAAEAREAISEIRQEFERAMSSLNSRSLQSDIEETRSKVKEAISLGSEKVARLTPPRDKSSRLSVLVKKGDSVKIAGQAQPAIVLEDPKAGKVLVQSGSLKMQVALSQIVSAEQPHAPRPKKTTSRLQKSLSASREIQLRRLRAEDAQESLEKFIDEAVLAGLHSVRIVHGKGEGVLRKLSQDLLRRHRDVKRFYEAPPEEGGQGVTIAEFE